MDITQAIIIGIIEGFTEFLPVSSTGHMVVASHFLGVPQTDVVKAYEVIIQFAAIVAVMLLYREKINFKEVELWQKVVVAAIPILAIGALFKKDIEGLFMVSISAWMFIIGGIIFLIVEYFYDESKSSAKELETITWKQSIAIGLGQVLALIPGTSRAGSTIITGMLAGVSRQVSTEFSFLVAIPVMAAVSADSLLEYYDKFLDANISAFVVGFIVAFIVAYLTIKLFIAFLQRFTFVAFGVYRILFGILLLMIV